MEIKFRPAVCHDHEKVVPLIYSAGADIHDFLYKDCSKNVNEFLKYSFKSGKGFFGYRKQIVGTYHDEIIFSATVYKGNEFLKLTFESLILHKKFFTISDMLLIIKKTFIINKIFTAPSFDGIYIANVGTNPEFRNKGIGSNFFIETHESAKKSGIKKCELDVSVNNPNAQRLYEKLGYKVLYEKNYQNKNFSDGVKRMQFLP